jgi:phage shock protein PspC (stress-responsive transcriptional regulator)
MTMQNSVPAAQTDGQPAIAAAAGGHPEAPLALPLRNDTILGVCQGLGEEFGFHANWLRVPIAGLVMFNWVAAFAIYFALGVALMIARLLYPRRTATAQLTVEVAQPAGRSADNNDEQLSAAA